MGHETPTELKYTEEHEWVRRDGDFVTIGITDFAQSQLGDIVFVELPAVGTALQQNSVFGVVESIKSVSDLYCPIDGEVVEVNSALESAPEAINEGPYQSWLIKLKETGGPEQFDALMNCDAYKEHCD